MRITDMHTSRNEPPERCAELYSAVIRTVVQSGIPLFPGISPPVAADVGPWSLWVNPRRTCLPVGGVSIPPQAVYVRYRGAPVGVVQEDGGGFVPMSRGRTMDNLLKCLKAVGAMHMVLNDGLRKHRRSLWKDVIT